MTTVTLNSAGTPSSAIIAAANTTVTITDAQGRNITIKRIGALDRLKMFEVIGSANAGNEAYLGYAALAFHVTAIDGDPIIRPTSKLQLEALVQRLDDDGLQAVAMGVATHFAPASVADDIRAAVKNG